MSYYGAEIHKFILGELRTDEWKSDWRREQERRRVEEMGKRQFVAAVIAPQIKVRRERKPKAAPKTKRLRSNAWRENDRLRRAEWRTAGLCQDCGREPMLGRHCCVTCATRRRSYYAKKAGIQLNTEAILGRTCKECGKLLNANNRYGYCGVHYKSMRRVIYRDLKQAA